MELFDKAKERASSAPEIDRSQGHTIAYSRTTSSRLMGVLDANANGNVHGGVIMRMVDEAAAVVAIKHSHRNVVTARVERFDFLAPAYLGDVVSVHCELQYVGRTSMEVGVRVTAEDPLTGEVRHVASSRVIYVALDEHGKPTPVPPLVPGDEEERAIIERARLRRQRMQKLEEELAKLEAGSPE
ncbi:acyl-CoA thioesterase [Thermogemmatispora sp.]|uniref:acyl-CoA thioesterase n=1 Tax=Thermogemmatispora sp. TaxID=1968838 RepID=UPI001DBDFB22|nr:acyl-CoA thioesterase [Thermogemmatispora sp.]MBX5449496.1 acyl-CoA thioesterase [Thermogemmatispora sp.]